MIATSEPSAAMSLPTARLRVRPIRIHILLVQWVAGTAGLHVPHMGFLAPGWEPWMPSNRLPDGRGPKLLRFRQMTSHPVADGGFLIGHYSPIVLHARAFRRYVKKVVIRHNSGCRLFAGYSVPSAD